MEIKGEISEQTDMKLIEIIDRTKKSSRDEDNDLFYYARIELEKRIKKYRKYYDRARHYHVAGTIKGLDIDICAECGEDLRSDIHFRSDE